MLRLLFLSHVRNDPDAGASRVYHVLRNRLLSLGHDVDLLHLDDVGMPTGRSTELLARRVALPSYVSRAGRTAIDQKDYDVVMSSSGMAGPLFRNILLSGKRRRPRLVNHVHGLSVFDHLANLDEGRLGHVRVSAAARLVTGPFQARWDRVGVRYADRTVVQNVRDRSEVSSMVGSRKVSLIRPALSEQFAGLDSVRGCKRDRPIDAVLWFGTWEARKGCHYVPDAFRRLREQRPSATLTLGGTGMSEAAIKSEFAAVDRPSVRVLPRIDVATQVEVFGSHSLFLFPSLSEGFGLALLEAMFHGLVPVTSTTGAGGDLVLGSGGGLVVPVTSEHLGSALCELTGDPAKVHAMRIEARRVAEKFTSERMADEYVDLFEELCSS